MSINCIIIDDEPMARKLLAEYCRRVDFLRLIGDFSSGLSAISFLKDHQVDLIFLDIKMPDISGLELKQVIHQSTGVIFTTAFSEYAVDAFELNAIDYLLKPFDFPRFLKAVNKVNQLSNQPLRHRDIVQNDFLFVKDGRASVKVYFRDIRYIKGQKDYVQFQLPEKRILSLMNLKDLEQALPKESFIRIHQSYIINSQHIKSVSNNKMNIGNEFLPISQTYRLHVKAFLDKYS